MMSNNARPPRELGGLWLAELSKLDRRQRFNDDMNTYHSCFGPPKCAQFVLNRFSETSSLTFPFLYE